MVTDPQTQTNPQTEPITMHCAAKLSALCNYINQISMAPCTIVTQEPLGTCDCV